MSDAEQSGEQAVILPEETGVPPEESMPEVGDEMIDDTLPEPIDGDVDSKGHLAAGLFVGVIAVLLVVIYAFSMAA